jgi:hypothetical protein
MRHRSQQRRAVGTDPYRLCARTFPSLLKKLSGNPAILNVRRGSVALRPYLTIGLPFSLENALFDL